LHLFPINRLHNKSIEKELGFLLIILFLRYVQKFAFLNHSYIRYTIYHPLCSLKYRYKTCPFQVRGAPSIIIKLSEIVKKNKPS